MSFWKVTFSESLRERYVIVRADFSPERLKEILKEVNPFWKISKIEPMSFKRKKQNK